MNISETVANPAIVRSFSSARITIVQLDERSLNISTTQQLSCVKNIQNDNFLGSVFWCLEKSSIYLENTFVCFFAPLARTFRRTKKSSAIGGRGAAFERGGYS